VKILVHSGAKTALAGGGLLRFQRSRQNDSDTGKPPKIRDRGDFCHSGQAVYPE
jgi:hypothetical protein